MRERNCFLLLGPPCAGKSTIGSHLSQFSGFPFIILDSYVDELCKELELQEGELLNDRQIDIAVHRFLEDLKKYVLDGDCIFELPYHDYQKLWMEFHKIRNYLTIVLIEADVDILLQRNYQRHPSRQIPTEYIRRSLESLGNFRIVLHKEQFAFLFFNTGLVSVHTIVSSIMDLRDM